jgi:fructuronate reductase
MAGAVESPKRFCVSNAAEVAGLSPLRYDRQKMVTGIVHLGVGAFHRAHQAVFHHKALLGMDQEESAKWGIVGVSLRSPGVRDQLAPQDCLYTVHERASQHTDVLLVGCLQQCLVAPEDPSAVVELLASPTVRIVTLTVTEKGYCYEPATRALDMKNADIAHDLQPEHARKPRSAIGFLVQALKMRRESAVEPFTVVTCDNLPHNGKTLADICIAFAAELDKTGDLSTWIISNVYFPSTMVDCIVPATKESDILNAASERLGGLQDQAMVVCEPFRQWVIQDTFGPLGRPPWDEAGVQLVQHVAEFEDAKLSILNGCHSTLAYAGFLCGIELIWQVMTRAPFRTLARALLECDVIPTLTPPEGVDLERYADTVLGRFANTALEHRTSQIAMDGSQKLPQRLLKTARKHLDNSAAQMQVIPFAVAARMRYVRRQDQDGEPIRVQDPLAESFANIARSAKGNAQTLATSLFGLTKVFGDDELVQAKDGFVEPVIQHLEELLKASDDDAVFAYLSKFTESLPRSCKRTFDGGYPQPNASQKEAVAGGG